MSNLTPEIQLLINSYLITVSFLFFISIFYLVKIFKKYNSIVSLQFLFIFWGLNFRSISIFILFLNNNFDLIDKERMNFLNHFLLFVLFSALVYFAHAFNEMSPKGVIKKLSLIPVYMYLLLAILALVDFLLPQYYFFKISIDELGLYTPSNHLIVLLSRFLGSFIFLGILFYLIVNRHKYPSIFISWDYSKYLIIVLVLTFFSYDFAIITDTLSTFIPNISIINDIFYILVSIIITTLILIIHRNCANNTFFNIFFGKDIKLAIRDGIIGYIVASMTDKGPEALLISENFRNYSKISENTVSGLSITAIVNVGAFREEATTEFQETISIIPVPNKIHLSALSLSFNTLNEKLAEIDSRMRNGIATVLLIIFPSDLMISLHKFLDILPILKSELKKNKELDHFLEKEFIEELTFKIIKEMIY